MTNPNFRVSIALCTRNSTRFLAEQLDSFLNQTRAPDEIIVVDDSSQDGTLALLSSYQDRLPIRIFTNSPPLGFVRNFERALTLCTGNVIFFSDHDDIWYPKKIETILHSFAERPDVAVVFSDATLVDEKNSKLNDSFWTTNDFSLAEQAAFAEGAPLAVLLKKAVAAGNSMAFRKELLAEALPIPEGWYHDEWIMALAASASTIEMVKAPLLAYRQHGSQAIGVADSGFVNKLKRRLKRASGRKYSDFKKDYLKWDSLTKRSGNNSSSLKRKLAFHSECAAYPKSRILRIFPIAGQVLRGNYHEFGNGWPTALRDLLAHD